MRTLLDEMFHVSMILTKGIALRRKILLHEPEAPQQVKPLPFAKWLDPKICVLYPRLRYCIAQASCGFVVVETTTSSFLPSREPIDSDRMSDGATFLAFFQRAGGADVDRFVPPCVLWPF